MESCGGFQVWQFMGWVVFPRACWSLWVGLWKNIKKGCEIFSGFTRFVVGDGTRTRFWHDVWCRDTVLKEAFPVLFGIAWEKDASVADNMEILGGSIQWDVSFA